MVPVYRSGTPDISSFASQRLHQLSLACSSRSHDAILREFELRFLFTGLIQGNANDEALRDRSSMIQVASGSEQPWGNYLP